MLSSKYFSIYNHALISTSTSTPLSVFMQTFWKESQRNTGTLLGLAEMLGPILWAVPKKRMRSANKWLKDKTNIVNCPSCGQRHLTHHLCFNCYKDFSNRER
jgi:large subunit ribosomal protein L32